MKRLAVTVRLSSNKLLSCYSLQHNIIKMTDSSEAFKTWLKGKTLRDKAVEVILITVSILFYFVLRLICFLVH